MRPETNTIIVCGGRNYSDARMVSSYLSRLTKPFRIVTGGAPGADRLAEEWAKANGVECVVVPADWTKHGRAAGPIRNQRMLDEHQPCAVVAFPGRRGTRDMKARAAKAGVPIYEPVLQLTREMARLINEPSPPTEALARAFERHGG